MEIGIASLRCYDRDRLRAIAAGGGPSREGDDIHIWCPLCACQLSGDVYEPNHVDPGCRDLRCPCHDESLPMLGGARIVESMNRGGWVQQESGDIDFLDVPMRLAAENGAGLALYRFTDEMQIAWTIRFAPDTPESVIRATIAAALDSAPPRRRPARCGHSICYDADGHTDGCLYDGDGGGD